jgi:hypothetical protein
LQLHAGGRGDPETTGSRPDEEIWFAAGFSRNLAAGEGGAGKVPFARH